MKPLDVFIAGELIDLCIPTEEFARESNWYSWFNNNTITKYLEQGVFPNSPDDQVNFFKTQKSSGRLMLIISNKRNYMGIISLSKIDLIKKTCDIALVVDSSIDKKMSPFISLEAMARVSEHAFINIGINRIEAGQHQKLKGWQQRLELLGYKLEGIHTRKFVKKRELANSVSIACTYNDYLEIIKIRGHYWDCLDKMIKRINLLPEKSFADILNCYFSNERESYYNKVFSL